MQLCEALGKLIDSYKNVSRVNVYCPPDQRDLAIVWFEMRYMFRLGAAIVDFERFYKRSILRNPCNAKEDFWGLFDPDPPFQCIKTDSGFMIRINELEIRPVEEHGDRYYPGYGEKAFHEALKDLKLHFEDLSYEGYVNYMLSDTHAGVLVSYEIKDNPENQPARKQYDWIWKTLGEILAAQTYLPSEGMPSSEEVKRLHFACDGDSTHFFPIASATEYILEAHLDKEITAETDCFITSNRNGRRSKEAKKAQKLGVPILTEDEFIEKFGLQEYRKQGYPRILLFLLKEENDSEAEEAENTIRDLYACKEWIRQDVLEDVVRKIIRLVAENQPETAERLRQRADVFPALHLSGKPAESMCQAHDERSKPRN